MTPTHQPSPKRRGPRLAAVLLLAMLGIVLLSVVSTFAFSNLAVEREFRKLPPEVQSYLRAQQAAARQGQVLAPAPPIPEIRTGSPADAYLPQGWSSPSVNGEVLNPNGQAVLVQDGRRVRTGQGDSPRRWLPPEGQPSDDFLRNIQRSLLQVGLIAGLASALLAWLLARRVAQPITAVSQAAKKLAQGDLSVRAPLLSGEREVTDLALSFNDMAHSLQTLDREQRQAVADIAHELRTPLAVMQARLDALEDGVYPLNTDQIRLLSTQTQLLTRLVGDLRTLTLADAGRLGLTMRDTDLGRLTEEVVWGLQDRAVQRDVKLQVSVMPAPLRADTDRLRQIVTNLVENALRHARAQVQVQVTHSGGQLVLHVDDDGSGIPAESRESVFTRFTRLDDSRARDTGGSGLGLAIVRALATAHGGQTAASASPLGGARLSVIFPSAAS